MLLLVEVTDGAPRISSRFTIFSLVLSLSIFALLRFWAFLALGKSGWITSGTR
jgi:hypothetical protein